MKTRQLSTHHPRSPSQQPENPREKFQRPPGGANRKSFVEDASTVCSRSHHGQLGSSIRSGPTPSAPEGLRLPPNPESTPPTSTPAPLDADYVFPCISRTRAATASGFRLTSPPRRPLPAQRPQKVRSSVSDNETAFHPFFLANPATSGRRRASTTSPASSPSLKTPTRKRLNLQNSDRKWRYSSSKVPSTAPPTAGSTTTGSSDGNFLIRAEGALFTAEGAAAPLGAPSGDHFSSIAVTLQTVPVFIR